MIFTAKEFKDRYYSPVVYCWIRGQQWLYVGKCYYGFRRMLTKHTDFRMHEMEDTDTIEIYQFDTRRECLRVERMLIYQHKPLYNGKQGRKSLGGIADYLKQEQT